jgi:hypothetical protein
MEQDATLRLGTPPRWTGGFHFSLLPGQVNTREQAVLAQTGLIRRGGLMWRRHP